MTPERAELLARITAFDIDGGEVALPFAARLARENGWTRGHADRVVAEYKRFLFLAASGTRPVCPSEDVDAAWHLHLTYTRSYWGRLCREVLGRPLHHDPTRGGPAEAQKHDAMYAHTFAVYREAFGHEPPTDIWPPAERRFGADTRHRVVNTASNWVIPKAPVRRAAALVCGFAVAAVLVPGCGGGFNPFALRAADFLAVLVLAIAAAGCAGAVIRSVQRKPDPEAGDDTLELDWAQTAYLAGGAARLTTAAVARVTARGLAKVSDDGKTLQLAGPTPDDATPVERAVLRALPVTNESAALKPVQEAVEMAFRPRAEQLQRDGLELTPAARARVGLAAILPLAVAFMCLSVPRVLANPGDEGTPAVVIVSALGGLFVGGLLTHSLRLSNRGRNLLVWQKTKHAALKSGAEWGHTGDAAMAVALFGTAALAGTALAPLQTWYPRQTAEASSDGCGGGGCGSGCGAGCGGDGGGGCGGGCGGGGD
jgi:uncharacterized protein (TIGR04222 family)